MCIFLLDATRVRVKVFMSNTGVIFYSMLMEQLEDGCIIILFCKPIPELAQSILMQTVDLEEGR